MTESTPLADLEQIRDAIGQLPGPDADAAAAARRRQATLTKPPGSLGRLEELAVWLAAWQHGDVAINHPRVCVFAASHGVAARGVSAFPATVTAQMVQNFLAGGAAVNQLARIADADLRVYELAVDQPTADICDGPAMAPGDCASAFAYGMTAVEPGVDLLAVGEMGIANTTSAAALCLALFGGDAAAWTGPGTGVDGAALQRKIAAVAAAVAANPEAAADPLVALQSLGGRELAAIAGAVTAARFAGVPVLLDGFVATTAAAVLYAVDPAALDHCRVAHCSAEPGHQRLLDRIGQDPLLRLDMRLGEASGAALAINLVRAAAACHADMATFEAAAVSQAVDGG